jgi:hypothetical protein
MQIQLRRRKLITLLGGAAAWPLAARAQQAAGKLPRIGSIQTFQNENTEAFSQGLREAGYVDGPAAAPSLTKCITASWVAYRA